MEKDVLLKHKIMFEEDVLIEQGRKFVELLKDNLKILISEDEAQEFLDWIVREKNLSFKVRDLDKLENGKILREKFGFKDLKIWDIKVFVKYGPDDKIYNQKGEKGDMIRDLVTRGCSLIKIEHEKGRIEWRLFNGFCKFSGMTDQDDDDMMKVCVQEVEKKQKGLRPKKEKNENEKNNKAMKEKHGNGKTDVIEEISVKKDIIEEISGKTEDKIVDEKVTNAEKEVEKDPKVGKKESDDVFFKKSFSEAQYMLRTRKENGKAAHFSAFEVQTDKAGIVQFYYAGSKNVHILFTDEDELKEFDDSILHVRIAYAMMDMLKSMEKEKEKELLHLLSSTNLVANFEIMLTDDQHVVDYTLAKDEPRFIAFTGRRISNDFFKEQYGLCFPVPQGLFLAKHLGVPVVSVCTLHDFSEEKLASLIREIRNDVNSEGSVIYFLDKNFTCFGMWKLKTVFYVCLRAIREKILQMGPEFNKRVQNRFANIQTWLGLTDEETMYWRILASNLLLFIKKEVDDGNLDIRDIRGSYAVEIRKFLSQYDPKQATLLPIPEDIKQWKNERLGKKDNEKPKQQKKKFNKKNKQRFRKKTTNDS